MMRINVLDHGFVELVDHMGDDRRVEQAARVSYVGTRDDIRSRDKTRNLIRYMMSHGHTSPFEHVHFTFAIKCPIFVWRQWIRHRTANVNEISGRYAELAEECYVPDVERLQKQSQVNHQGSSDEQVEDAPYLQKLMREDQDFAFESYRNYLSRDVAKELARINLPLATYTEAYWTMDLHNLFGFLAQRLDSHAQAEIQAYAGAIANLIQQIVPLSFEAFLDYRMNSVRFSAEEQKALARFLDQGGILEQEQTQLTEREWVEFREKVKSIEKSSDTLCFVNGDD